MTHTAELNALIAKARALGAEVFVVREVNNREGRDLISCVQVSNAPGIGPHSMGPISAAEALRAFIARAN